MVVLPTQMGFGPVIETKDPATTDIITDESDLHPEKVLVYTNLAFPPEIPVTSPEFVIEAIPLLEDVHVPPEEGRNCVVEPTQI